MPGEEKSGRRDGWVRQPTDASVETTSKNSERRFANELNARAAQPLSLLGEMTGGVAHDFRNILAVIASGLRLAENNLNDPGAASTFRAAVRDGVAQGLALTSQLLIFAKQGESQARLANANELLNSLEIFLRYGAGSNVHVVFELSPNIPNCLIDPSQFNAAILNLVINARDAMPEGGEVRIGTAPWVVHEEASDAKPGHYVRVRVSDNGLGMSNAIIQKIFQPFFTTKGERGTGLGIPQVNSFMRNIGGHLRVASSLGRGTTFDLFFPAEPNDTQASCIDIEAAACSHSAGILSLHHRRPPCGIAG